MLPPGRRRISANTSRPLCLALLFILFISTANAAGSVLGIDFGTLNLKAALVKPGIPLEIVLTKDSKRKEVAAVAFKPTRDSNNNIIAEAGTFPERAYGGDALALQGRFPGEVFPNLKPLLGLVGKGSGLEAMETFKERYPAVQVQHVPEMGTTMVKSSAFVNEEMPWSVEELLAMEFANIRRNAESMAGKGSSVDDVVISIPAFYTADERRAIERAATLAEFDMNALVSDGLAVGIDYAKSRTFPEVTKGEQPEHHIVFDMGAGSTTATLLRFQSRSVKDVGRFNKTVQEVAVLGAGWDRTLGGDGFTNVILDDYVSKFLTKPQMKNRAVTLEDVTSNGRVMSRLWREAEKARQVLSANTETSSSFEELLPDIDFKTKLSRSDFESLAAEFVDRVARPIEDALVAAKLEMKDIDSIILHGGAVRTPFVQKKLEEITGGSAKLRSNVNADESAVFGAAFKGAGLSPSFKVKEIRDSDIAGYAAGMVFTEGGKERRQVLFSPLSAVGSGAATKQVTFKDKDDFTFRLYQQVGEVERSVTRIETLNLTDGVKQLKSKFGCEKDEISTKFSIKLSAIDGLPTVTGGSVSCEVEGDGKAESLGDSVKGFFGFGKKDQDPLADGEEEEGPVEDVEATTSAPSSAATDSATTSSLSSTISKAPEKPKKRTETVAISFTLVPEGNPQPAKEEMQRMRDRLAAFDRSDRARTAREEAVNVLESYTYYVRDFLTNTDYTSVSTDSQREAISKLLASTREFMESPSEIGRATKEALSEKLKDLKKLVEPIQGRRREDLARPEKVEALRSSLEQTGTFVEMVREQLKKAEEAKSQAEASQAAASSASSDSEAVTPPADDLSDLEEPEASPSAAKDLPPTLSSAPESSPYTDDDLAQLSSLYESISSWLASKEAEQSKLSPSEEPVLLVKDIEKKAEDLGSAMRGLLYKKMTSERKASSARGKASKTKSSKKSKKTSSPSTEGEEATPAAGEEPAFVTINPEDGGMPSEEDIMRMVREATEKQKSSSSIRDEL